MTLYKAPLDDMRFALYDVLGVESVLGRLDGKVTREEALTRLRQAEGELGAPYPAG